MRNWLFVLCIAALMGCFVSCDDDTEIIYVSEEAGEEVLITDQSGTTVLNTKDIVIGEGGEDVIFEMSSTILDPELGKVTETTLNACGMGALALDGNKVDPNQSVENVTVINKGTITVHTKDLVERYIDQVQTPDDKTLPYTYLRVLVMYAGENSTVVNEGTINIYYDHDPSIAATVYVMALVAGEGSSIINNGEVHFYGTGSPATRVRGVSTFGDNISVINNGIMTAEVDMASDSRMITTGGTKSNVINNGTMQMRMPGNILCLTRYGDTNLINNNVIEVTSVNMPEEYDEGTNQIVCAMYEPLQAARTSTPSLVNRGTIKVAIEGSDYSKVPILGFGMYCDLMSSKAERLEVNIINEGDINLSQSGSKKYSMAEAGFVAKPAAATGACNIKLGKWQTTLRDFSQPDHLFLAIGAKVDFTGGELILKKGDNTAEGTAYSIAPEALLYRAGGDSYRYEYTGYDYLNVQVADSTTLSLDWDKENKTASLRSK